MSLPDLIIRYRHDKGDTCTGELLLRWSEGSLPAAPLHQLECVPFNRMMALVSEELNKTKVEKLIMERTDHGGLRPFVFENPMMELLRADPVAAIRMMNIPAIHIDLRKDKPLPAAPLFRAGHDAMAHGFSDTVYVRVRNKELECPCCGMWSPVDAEFLFTCQKKCKLTLPVVFTESWGLVKVESLLNLNLERYYLPRDWNPAVGWISQQDLRELLDTWKKEKTS